jgi:hypothetical protein
MAGNSGNMRGGMQTPCLRVPRGLSRYYIYFIDLGASGGLLRAVFGADGVILWSKHAQEYLGISGQGNMSQPGINTIISGRLPRNAQILFRCFRPGGALWTT